MQTTKEHIDTASGYTGETGNAVGVYPRVNDPTANEVSAR